MTRPRPLAVRSANLDRVEQLAELGRFHWRNDPATLDAYIVAFDALKGDGDAEDQFGDAVDVIRDAAGAALADFIQARHLYLDGWDELNPLSLGEVAALLIFDWMEE